MTTLLLFAAGAGLAIFAAALGQGSAALFWPRIADHLLSFCVVVGGLAAFASAVAPGRLRERLRRHAGSLVAGALAAAAAALVALVAISRDLLPGAGLELHSFPLWFPPLAAAPFAAVAVAAVARCSTGRWWRAGGLAAGLGAGCLVAAGLAASSLPVRSPWFGGHLLEFQDAGGGSSSLGVDRRLREGLLAPAAAAPLTYVPRPARGKRVEVLLVGLPSGPVLTTLLGWRRANLTILEEDPGLVAEVLKRWPALAAARDGKRARIVTGNPRWWLDRSEGRYDLVILSEGWSFAAYLSRALNPRRDLRWTVEAFRSYIAHLAPKGYLLVQRDGMGRVVSTLREASGVPGSEFRYRVIVFGDRGRLASQCWYRTEGLADRYSLRTAVVYARRNGTQMLYKPSKYPSLSFYDPLVTSERVKGLYFSTPLDLSPPLDERPFFDHHERLAISPMGRSMPEELEPPAAHRPMRVIPSGDLGAWGVLLLGSAIALLLRKVGANRAARGGGGEAGAARAWAPGVFLGALAALAFEAFEAWAHWLAPSAPAAQAAIAALLLGAVAGAFTESRRPGRFPGLIPAAAVLSLGAYAAYRAAPALQRLGWVASALAVAAAGALLGALLGRALHAALRELAARLPGSAAWAGGSLLCAAPLAWLAGSLAATHFGYRLLWALAAVAALAALRSLRTLPALPGTRESGSSEPQLLQESQGCREGGIAQRGDPGDDALPT